MKINITRETLSTFREVGKGEVFMIGNAVYMRMTDKRTEGLTYNTWSFNLNDLAHVELNANVIIPQKVTLEVTL